MKVIAWIQSNFWLFMLSGLILGFIAPRYSGFLMQYLEWSLIFMLLLVFLKIDLRQILERFRDFRLMLYVSFCTLILIPAFVYGVIYWIAPGMAVGMLLLTSMPSGIGGPALADLLKGNIELAMSLTIFTSFLAPLTVPALFLLLAGTQVSIDAIHLFYKLAVLVFLPMIASVVIKKATPVLVERTMPFYSATNVLIFFFFVYATIGAQRHLLLANPWNILGQLGIVYLVYLFLHLSGAWIAYGKPQADRISIVVSNAYQNNGMAIVLAALLFEPSVLVLMVLSEFPWNTMPALYGWWLKWNRTGK